MSSSETDTSDDNSENGIPPTTQNASVYLCEDTLEGEAAELEISYAFPHVNNEDHLPNDRTGDTAPGPIQDPNPVVTITMLRTADIFFQNPGPSVHNALPGNVTLTTSTYNYRNDSPERAPTQNQATGENMEHGRDDYNHENNNDSDEDQML